MRAIFAIVLALTLTACGDGRRREPHQISDAQCLGVLRNQNVAFTPRGTINGSGSCRVDNAVAVQRASLPLNRETVMSCQAALNFEEFNREVVQPAARRHLGSEVTRVQVFAGYSCRSVRGQAGRLSEHARGRAIDVGAFQLADGRTITVERGWRGTDAERAFLRAVARGACNHFQLVLTPNSDRDHYNHFHLDLGPWQRCDA